MSLREKAELCVDGSMLRTAEMPQHGIPKLVMSDGTSGVRFFNTPDQDPKQIQFEQAIDASFDSDEALSITEEATCFPAGSCLACSWDTGLAGRIGAAVAEECKRLNIGLLYGPGMNTRRSPLDGRGFEYYSEDPILSGDMAAGYVNGLQGNGVAACVKHFACNNSNYLRTKYDNIVEERALHEIFLAGFERAIKKSAPAALMGSYNPINGVHSCENKWLLTDLLRNDWRFEGAIISDCGAIKDHIKAFSAGLNFEMPHSKIAIDKLVNAVENGELDESVLDYSCEKILEVVMKYAVVGKQDTSVDFIAHHKLAQEAASECAVLLKNDDRLLPLSADSDSKIAVIGKWAEAPVYQGTGCAIVNAQRVDIPLDEIRGRSKNVIYATGYNDPKTCDEALLLEAELAAKNAKTAIVFAGAALPPETDDFNRGDLNIEPAHEALIRRVAAVNKNTVVVIMNCESVVMPWIDDVRAVLDMWYCGEGCGAALAKLLFGEISPSGKLPVTMPKRLQDCPDYLHFPGENHRQLYGEGIFVGYRYYEKKQIETLFSFGHGLSYTQFTYSDIVFSKSDITLPEQVTVSCIVENSGGMEGSEVVQLYVSDGHARLHRPVKELKAFQKIYLRPGENQSVSFTLSERDFAYYDPAFSDWVVDSGRFSILIGSSSADIRLSEYINVVSNNKRTLPISADSHYMELFENEQAKKILFDSIVEWGLAKPEDITPELEKNFYNSFWGIAQHLDLLVPYQVTEEMVNDMVRKMNECREWDWGI